MLLQESERLISDAGYSRAWLDVATGKTAARGVCERRGWTDAGSFENHAPGAGAHIIVDSHR